MEALLDTGVADDCALVLRPPVDGVLPLGVRMSGLEVLVGISGLSEELPAVEDPSVSLEGMCWASHAARRAFTRSRSASPSSLGRVSM